MRKINAVLFDLGSTLIYFDDDWQSVIPVADQALVESLAASGVDLSEGFIDEFRSQMRAYNLERETEFIEYTTQYLLRSVLEAQGHEPLTDDVLRRALEAFFRVTESHWKTEADALLVLQDLQAQGYRLGLVSNAGDDANVQRLVDRAGVRPYFEALLTSAAEGIRKPNPKIMLKALEALGVPPAQAVMVGDTLGADMLGAHNAGIFSVWITRRAVSPANQAHLDTIHPDASIASLEELLYLLETLN
jgi:HAD superfamily hydrolase (TIGR01662 family)